MATATNDKPVRLGDLPVVKTNILENARQYDKGVVGGYNGAFPLTAASEGGIYLLPSTGKFYVCETAYNGAQISAPNSNFVELSVWKNHDRLKNLPIIDCGITEIPSVGDDQIITIKFNKSFKHPPVVTLGGVVGIASHGYSAGFRVEKVTTVDFKLLSAWEKNQASTLHWIAISL